jgi:uncharacterized protein YecE (DUF72 family)
MRSRVRHASSPIKALARDLAPPRRACGTVAAMRMRVGTSGFSYDQWEGGFYPAGLAADDRLSVYAQRLGTVEINNTFYRMPKRDVLRRWAAAVPDGFRFVIKASRRITHEGRLEDAGGALEVLLRQLEVLGDKRGPILFQTPHYLRKNVERLRAFVARLPPGVTAAFELRHRGWDDPEVHEVLATAGHAWCAAEHEPDTTATEPDANTPPAPPAETPLVRTAAWGYLRLHAPAYDDARLQHWAERIRETWDDAWVFFSHEETAPHLALRMRDIAQRLPGVELS